MKDDGHLLAIIGRLTRCRRAVAVASIAIATCACAASPALDGIGTVALSAGADPIPGPVVDLDGDSRLSAAGAAEAGINATEGCGPLLPVCAILTVPVAAIVGATARTTQKLPEEQAYALNRVTAHISGSMDLRTDFANALRDEARLRGLTLAPVNVDARVLIRSASLSWDVSLGNNVAIRMDIDVDVITSEARRSGRVTYRSGSAKVADWILNDGDAIRQALEAAPSAASQLLWQQLLGPA